MVTEFLTDKYGLQVNPQILNGEPILDDFRRRRQILHPLLDGLFEWGIVSAKSIGA